MSLKFSQDPDGSSKQETRRRRTYQGKKIAIFAASFALAVFLGSSLFPAPRAEAGVFSFITGLFSNTVPTGLVSEINSQTISLLAAPVNANPNAAKGGGDVAIVGNSALLSEVGPSGTLADIEDAPPASDQISLYVVREGDTLSQIAGMFGVSANTIIWANDIKQGDLIRVGQTLVILPVSGVRHTVKRGETLAGIAKQYGGSLEEILQFNNFPTDASLAVGDVILIPNGEIAAPQRTAAKTTTKKSSSGSSSGAHDTNGPSYEGYYIHPLPGGVKTQGLHGYNAIDVGAPAGTPLIAAAEGDVIIVRNSGWNGGYGNYVVIKHRNGTQTLYAHNSKNIVYVGQRVVQGQVIGYVGSSGNSTGPHVHFEIRGAKNPF